MKQLKWSTIGGVALSLFITTCGSSISLGQTFSVGSLDTPNQPLTGFTAVYTVINASHPATRDGEVRTVSLLWSTAPCPAAIKIKQFRAILTPNGRGYRFVNEQGPFDISGHTTTVTLSSPLNFKSGDFLGLGVLSDCGSPMLHQPDPTFGAVFSFVGDLKSDVFPPTTPSHPTGSLDIAGYEDTSQLFLLGQRFAVSITLTDPRTGRVTTGVPTLQTDRSGSFSAPIFTGDSTLPEVVVKMTDATSVAPPFGGFFWVFYGSLTDTRYVLTIIDTTTGTARTYSSGDSFCGGADTAAFRP